MRDADNPAMIKRTNTRGVTRGLVREEQMSALVIVASRHGGTHEIGEVIAKTLRAEGVPCDVQRPEDVRDAEHFADYDAVIVGSPVYTGRWLPEARHLVDKYTEELLHRQVWMFSSGLADTPAKSSNRPAETQERMKSLEAVGHKHFTGRLDLSVLNFTERAIIAAARGKQGDRRDMLAVKKWAEKIAADIRTHANA